MVIRAVTGSATVARGAGGADKSRRGVRRRRFGVTRRVMVVAVARRFAEGRHFGVVGGEVGIFAEESESEREWKSGLI